MIHDPIDAGAIFVGYESVAQRYEGGQYVWQGIGGRSFIQHKQLDHMGHSTNWRGSGCRVNRITEPKELRVGREQMKASTAADIFDHGTIQENAVPCRKLEDQAGHVRTRPRPDRPRRGG